MIANRISRKKAPPTATTGMSRVEYLTCMKYNTTSVAFTTAIDSMTTLFRAPRSTNATATVIAVNTMSAVNTSR